MGGCQIAALEGPTKEGHRDCWTDTDYDDVLQFVERQLWLFVQQNASVYRPRQIVSSLALLSYQDLRLLERIYFLLSEPVGRSVRESIPHVLRHLPQSTDRVTTSLKGIVRSTVDWNLTTKRRLTSGDNDPTVFTTRIAAKTCDIPEMRALKYLLVTVNRVCSEVLTSISDQISLQVDGKWKTEIQLLARSTAILLKNVQLRNITLPDEVNSGMLQRVRRARNKHFKAVYGAILLYKRLFLEGQEVALRDCFAQGVLKPLSRDTLYELFVLFATTASLERAGWNAHRLRLIGYGNGAIGSYRRRNATLRLYYQTLPAWFAEGSCYGDLLRRHSIDVGLRRPDLLLEFQSGGREYKIVEVKRTQERRYVADSIYKVFGYMKDFERRLASGHAPRALLVVWDGIREDNTIDQVDDVALLTRRTYQSFLEKVVIC